MIDLGTLPIFCNPAMGSRFTPAALPGVAAWWTAGPTWCFTDAAKTAPAGNGDQVYTVADQSGNSRDLIQATLSKRPTLVLNGSRWELVFDGVDDFMRPASSMAAAFPSAATAAIRVNHTGLIGNQTEFISTRRNDTYSRFNESQSYPGQFRTTRTGPHAIIPQGWATAVSRSDASAWTRRLNGVQDISVAADYNASDANFAVGCAGTGAAESHFLSGAIREITLYSNYLSDANSALLEAYLGA